LLKVARKTVGYAEGVAELLESEEQEFASFEEVLLAQEIAAELRHYVSLIVRVISQTERRVLLGEKLRNYLAEFSAWQLTY